MGSIARKPLVSGIYVPTLSFFKDDVEESVDIEKCVQHNLYLAKAGVKGLVLQGSTGEAVCLTQSERKSILSATRQALDKQGYQDCVIIAGIGGQCLQESLAYARDAAEAGAAMGIALAPAYFIGQMTESVINTYFRKLADQSPIPFLVYNFPGVTNGLNLSAPFLASLSDHPNIVGTKLTCNTISKMQFLSPESENLKGQFQVLTGASSYLPAGYAAGIVGPITGCANLFPYLLVKLWTLISEGGDKKEIIRLQNMVTYYEEIMTKAFLPGNRATLDILGRPAGHSRSPVPDATPEEIEFYKKAVMKIAAEEKKLAP